MSKKSHFRGPFEKCHGKRGKTLLKFEQEHFYHISWSPRKKFSWKTSFLGIFKVLGLFVNTLTADDKYSLLNRNNLLQLLEIELSQKWKIFFELFCTFSKSRFNFEHFWRKDDPHSRCIFELTDSEKRCYINAWKAPFQTTLRQLTC